MLDILIFHSQAAALPLFKYPHLAQLIIHLNRVLVLQVHHQQAPQPHNWLNSVPVHQLHLWFHLFWVWVRISLLFWHLLDLCHFYCLIWDYITYPWQFSIIIDIYDNLYAMGYYGKLTMRVVPSICHLWRKMTSTSEIFWCILQNVVILLISNKWSICTNRHYRGGYEQTHLMFYKTGLIG